MTLCAAVVLTGAACGVMYTPNVMLDVGDPSRPIVYVGGLSWSDMSALRRAELSPSQWAAMYRVAVVTDAGPSATPVAGRYDLGGDNVRFTPMFPLDPGRTYDVVFDPRAANVAAIAGVRVLSGRVTVPARADAGPATTVAAVYPGGGEVPANLLRMYIEFSAPMGVRDGQNYVTLLDGQGRDMQDALLPLDTGLWNPERTRFTVLFDPGRVKRGILPNRAMGRPLKPGMTFTIAVRREWPDAHGKPLASDFRKEYRVGRPVERALATSEWRIAAPAAGSREPVVVTFRSPMDRGLAHRALTVARDGAAIAGEIRLETSETEWHFTPAEPWQPGGYAIAVEPILEDVSGNRIGTAFETLTPATAPPGPSRLTFLVRQP